MWRTMPIPGLSVISRCLCPPSSIDRQDLIIELTFDEHGGPNRGRREPQNTGLADNEYPIIIAPITVEPGPLPIA